MDEESVRSYDSNSNADNDNFILESSLGEVRVVQYSTVLYCFISSPLLPFLLNLLHSFSSGFFESVRKRSLDFAVQGL